MTDKEYDVNISKQLHGSTRGFKMRYILCAANWYNDGVKHEHEPVETGFIVCGRRHHNIFATVHSLIKTNPLELNKVCEQGFLTSDNMWVDRKEAAKIAFACGQITRETPILFSEDLY